MGRSVLSVAFVVLIVIGVHVGVVVFDCVVGGNLMGGVALAVLTTIVVVWIAYVCVYSV